GYHGRLGDGYTTSRSAPVRVRGVGGSGYLTGVTEITAGTNHACAVTTEDGAVCWGRGIEGQLGDGESADRSTIPVRVRGVDGNGYLTDVTEITAGSEYTCAVTADAEAVCWGGGFLGVLG